MIEENFNFKKEERDQKWKYADKLEIKKVWKQVKVGVQWS